MNSFLDSCRVAAAFPWFLATASAGSNTKGFKYQNGCTCARCPDGAANPGDVHVR